MKNILLAAFILISGSAFAQERFIGATRHYIDSFFFTYSEKMMSNDTAIVVKPKQGSTNWSYYKFDDAGIVVLAAKELQFFNEFTDLEKKLKAKKYKKVGEVEYNYVVRKTKGALYTNGKDNYIMMYDPINPNMSNSTRSVIYYKTK